MCIINRPESMPLFSSTGTFFVSFTPKPISNPYSIPWPHVSLPNFHRKFLLPKAASLSGSAADFPEQVAGETYGKRKRRSSVAGIEQDELVDPAELAEPDSVFFEFNGVNIHHKIIHHQEGNTEQTGNDTEMAKIGLPMILLHGFGASVFSWDLVMKPLARILRSRVLAFDRPAFGLTSRVFLKDTSVPNPYSMAFSVLATVSFIEMLGMGKAILLGHSAGCLVAVNTYFEAPEKVAALILVAPAIVAPLVLTKQNKENETGENQQRGDPTRNESKDNLLLRIWKGLNNFGEFIAAFVARIFKGIKDLIGSIYTKLVVMVLRSSLAVLLVRMVMNKFGILAIRNAWYDATQVTDHVLKGYTKPLKAKGWEKALLEFTIAMLTDSSSKSKPPLTKRLSEIKCPVLIITGDTDRLVPSWNAERLSRAIPNSTFEVIKNCGHVPQEEKSEEFLTVVEKFLRITFGQQHGWLQQQVT